MRSKALIEDFLANSSIEWWAHVTVTPDARRTAVFNRGTA